MSDDTPVDGASNVPPELFAVFSDEAEEKTLDISRQIADWKADPNDVAILVALQMRFAEYVSISRTLGLSLSAQITADVVSEITHVIAGERPAEDSLGVLFDNALHALDAAVEWLHGENVDATEVFAQDDELPPSTFELPDLRLAAQAQSRKSQKGNLENTTPSQARLILPKDVRRQEIPPGDPSLLALFMEECEELLAAADEAWESWSSAPSSSDGLPELKRHLHTIKGGARMVGMLVFGDVVHDLETAVSDPSVEVTKLIQSSRQWLDQLHHARDAIANGEAAVFGQPNASAALDEDNRTVVETVIDQADAAAAEKRQREIIRVPATTLDEMRRHSSSIGAYRARIEQLVGQLRLEGDRFSGIFNQLERDSADIEFLIEQLFRGADDQSSAASVLSDDDMDRIARFQLKLGDMRSGVYQLGRVHEQSSALLRDTSGYLSRQGRAGFELSESLLATRLVPVSDYSARLKRIVRQASEAASESSDSPIHAKLIIKGERLELDRALIERILGPLEHLLRNAVAHGIEDTALRRQSKKPETGNITLSFEKSSAQLKVQLQDDGRGLDTVKIRKIAEEKGLIDSSDELTPRQVERLIFVPGFSSSEGVSQLAGRGVGMDVVETEVRKLGGLVEVNSELGTGTQFHLDLPLGLSTIQGIAVGVNEERYAVPFAGLAGVVRLGDDEMRAGYDGQPIVFQGKSYKMVTLAEQLGLEDGGLPGLGQKYPTLLAESGGTRYAVVVERTYDTGEYAVQPLPPMAAKIPGLSGAVLQGDGSILPILDLITLCREGACKQRAVLREEIPELKEPEQFVWIVDNDPSARRRAAAICKKQGFGVTELDDGDLVEEHLDQALRAQGTSHEKQMPLPDLILSELSLPKVGALELINRLNRNPRYRDYKVAILASTGSATPLSRRQAKQSGAVGFVDKHTMGTKLAKKLNAILNPDNEDDLDASGS